MGGSPCVRARAFVRSSTVTRASLRSRQASSPYPTSTATTLRAPCSSRQSVNPPVAAPTSSARLPRACTELEASALASLIAPRDAHAGRSRTLIASPGSTSSLGLSARRSPAPSITSPAITAAAARVREENSPRSASSASRRMRRSGITGTVASRAVSTRGVGGISGRESITESLLTLVWFRTSTRNRGMCDQDHTYVHRGQAT